MYYDLPSPPIPELRPEAETTINRDITTLVHNLKNRNGEAVCEEAQVSLRTYADPRTQLSPTSKYLYEPVLNFVNDGLIPYYQSFGIDIFDLDGVAKVHDDLTNETNIIAPIFVAIDKNGLAQIIDGHDRAYLAILHHRPINAIVVEGVDLDNLTDGLPVSWEDVKVYDRFPQRKDKKNPRPGVELADMVDLSPLGSRGRRVEWLAKEAPYFHESPLGSTRKLVRQVNKIFKKFTSSGLFPSAINPEAMPGTSRVEKVVEAIPLDSQNFLAVINTEWVSTSGEVKRSTFIPIVEVTKADRPTSANLVVTTKEDLDNLQDSQPANEIAIPAELRSSINNLLASLNLKTIASQDHPDLPTTATKATGFHLVDINKKYFTMLVIDLEDHNSVSFMINSQDKDRENVYQGAVYVLRNQRDKVIFINEYRDLFGMKFLQLPRHFGYSPQKLIAETGIDIEIYGRDTQYNSYPECRKWENTTNTIVTSTLAENYPQKIPQAIGPKEAAEVVELTDQEVHDIIRRGQMHCDISNAVITIDQVNKGILIVNPFANIGQLNIILEKYYSPVDSKYYYRPPEAKTGSGMRIGQNSFPNTGSALVFGHTEISGDSNSLPSNVCYKSFSPQEVVRMITDGSLDSTAIAHLSHALRAQDVLVMSQ